MSKILSRETNTITIANFWENYLLGKYNFDPAYQRKSVWSTEKQSFLIDSILKNFPIPPIFLHQKIDDDTGKTRYDVIDGKQRLNAIIKFIKNEIPSVDESDKSPFYDEKISGIYFKDLDEKDLSEYKKKLWRYSIPIEYIDTQSDAIIDNIFDRLNRNGEKLKGQELRKSAYHGSPLLVLIENLLEIPFWKERLKHTDVSRMEDYEFLSELIFQLLEKLPLHANQQEIDDLYMKYARAALDWHDIEKNFNTITDFLIALDLDYSGYNISGVSHLYGLWCFADYCVSKNIQSSRVKECITEFYTLLRTIPELTGPLAQYKKSMSSRTKDKGQRKNRLNALIDFCNLQNQ